MQRTFKKEDPYKSIRKKVPKPGHAMDNVRFKRIKQKEQEIIETGIEEYEQQLKESVGDI